MKKKMLVTLLLLCSFMAVFAWFADLNGNWSGTLNTPDGQQFPLNYTFKVDGNKLTGTATNPQVRWTYRAVKLKVIVYGLILMQVG